MVVYTYTGKLTDFGDAPFPNAVPNLWCEPLRDAFSTTGPSAAKRIPITVQATGYFSVALQASLDLTPPTGYSLRCEWLNGSGVPGGWAQWDFMAAFGGGDIATMPGASLTRVWYGTEKPPVDRTGIFWWHSETDLIREWR